MTASKDIDERVAKAKAEYTEAWERHKTNPLEYNKPSYVQFARLYDLVPSTFRRRVQEETQSHAVAHTYQMRFHPGEEEAIAFWIDLLIRWGWPPAIWRVRDMAQSVLNQRSSTDHIGANWVYKFLERFPDLHTRFSTPIEHERLAALDASRIQNWFALYEEIVAKYNIHKRNQYNMDEKGWPMGVPQKEKVFCNRNELCHFKKMPGNRDWVSIIEAISADGFIFSPFIIFKGRVTFEAWLNEPGNKDVTFAISESGFSNTALCVEWFKHVFQPQSEARKQDPDEYRLIILDGHASHIATETIQYCVAHNIILLCLPSHTTHILQPLDVSFFRPLATNYSKTMSKAKELATGHKVTKMQFTQYYKTAREAAATTQNIESAWQKSGLIPFDPARILSVLPTNNRPTTPPEARITISDSTDQVTLASCTPHTVSEIQQAIKAIKEKGANGPMIDPVIEAVGKAAIRDNIKVKTLLATTEELLEKEKKEKDEANKSKGKYTDGQILNAATLKARRLDIQKRAWILQEKSVMSDFHAPLFTLFRKGLSRKERIRRRMNQRPPGTKRPYNKTTPLKIRSIPAYNTSISTPLLPRNQTEKSVNDAPILANLFDNLTLKSTKTARFTDQTPRRISPTKTPTLPKIGAPRKRAPKLTNRPITPLPSSILPPITTRAGRTVRPKKR